MNKSTERLMEKNMVNGLSHMNKKSKHFMAKLAKMLSESYKRLYNLFNLNKSTPATIYIFDSSLLNMQTGPIEVTPGGIERDGIDYSYISYIGGSINNPKDFVRIVDIH